MRVAQSHAQCSRVVNTSQERRVLFYPPLFCNYFLWVQSHNCTVRTSYSLWTLWSSLRHVRRSNIACMHLLMENNKYRARPRPCRPQHYRAAVQIAAIILHWYIVTRGIGFGTCGSRHPLAVGGSPSPLPPHTSTMIADLVASRSVWLPAPGPAFGV